MVNKIMISTALLALSANANAGVITSVFDSTWTDITTQPTSTSLPEDQTGSFDYVYPGWGGQEFDAEYLFYKIDGNLLSIGVQTGFDIVNGLQSHGTKNYYAGDLALSFNGAVKGDSSTYEYAVDFGFHTLDYYGGDTGTQNSGLYTVSSWNNGIYFDGAGGHSNSGDSKDSAAPFAMSLGSELTNVSFSGSNGFDTVAGETSYFQIATFDVSALGLTQLDLDAHWTMSCGNDAVDGHIEAAVPEPSSLLLLSAGFMGLMGSLVARRKRKIG